ncbi:MAG: NAD(P)-dependent oxidoreductase [Gaiellales bacterium]
MIPSILTIDPWVEPELFAPLLPGMRVSRATLPVADDACVAVITATDVPFAASDAAGLPGLKTVVTASVGYDHLDIAGLAALGVATFCAPAYCSDEVADHALASVLALWRGIPRMDSGRRAGVWDSAGISGLRRIAGSTLGVVGLGRIGRGLAQRARALEIQVLGYDPFVGGEAIRACGAMPVSLDELLAASDAVSLHLPLTDATSPLIGARELALMPPSGVLVNVSRAGLVDLDALSEALRAGRLAGAAFDVWDVEPPMAGDARVEAPNLMLSPHIAWASDRAKGALVAAVVAAVEAGLAGQDLVGRLGGPRVTGA